MVGKKPLKLSEGVSVEVRGQSIKVVGPLGVLALELPRGVGVQVENQTLRLEKDPTVSAAIFGLAFALVRNAVDGVSRGFTKELELVGVGYRVEKTAAGLKLLLGFSHPVNYQVPKGVAVEVPGNTKIKLTGIDKRLVAQTAAEIRKLRPPEPYKGKGIRYTNEVVRRKQGKVVKAAAGGGTT